MSGNTEIYQLLESTGHLFSDFSIDHVLALEHEDDFCIVIYVAASRNFTLYTAVSYLQQTDALPALISELQDVPKGNIPAFLLEQGVKSVEDKMHSQNSSRFYFDAH